VHGYDASVVFGGESGLDFVKQGKDKADQFDLLIADLNIPT
jgi:hypothetical protein